MTGLHLPIHPQREPKNEGGAEHLLSGGQAWYGWLQIVNPPGVVRMVEHQGG